MSTSIYLSSQDVTAVSGSIGKRGVEITGYATAPLPEGAMINGVITDERPLLSALVDLTKQGRLGGKDLRLVIDSSSILTRVETVPKLGRAQLLALTRNTFADSATGREDLLYDYAQLPDTADGRQQVLCSAVERQLVGSYVSLFGAAGLALSAIGIALDGVIQLLDILPQLHQKHYILCMVDGNVLITALFLAGSYRMSNRQRLLGARGTAACRAEMAQSVSSMVQFASAQKTGFSPDTVYFSGLRPEEQTVCGEINAALSLRAEPLPTTQAFSVQKTDPRKPYAVSDYLFATSGLGEK